MRDLPDPTRENAILPLRYSYQAKSDYIVSSKRRKQTSVFYMISRRIFVWRELKSLISTSHWSFALPPPDSGVCIGFLSASILKSHDHESPAPLAQGPSDPR